MSSFLKHREKVEPVSSTFSLLKGNIFYSGVDDSLISNEIKRLLNSKIELFHDKLKIDAPFIDIVGYLTDYKLITTTWNCGGYCSNSEKIIAYKSGGLRTIYHEVSHAFQAELGLFDKLTNILSEDIFIEQQCETMAYYLYNSIHKPLPAKYFNAYFDIDSVKFLADWYGDYKQK